MVAGQLQPLRRRQQVVVVPMVLALRYSRHAADERAPNHPRDAV